MPIIKPTENSAPVRYPDKDYNIVKYLDLTKYISLLQRQALFFCRLDKLEDQYEGTTPKTNYEDRAKYLQSLRDTGYFTIPFPDEEIAFHVKEYYESEKQFKSTFCVNCWNIFDGESAALWKIYSDFSKGIMIKSSVSKLEKAFRIEDKEIQLSVITYRDYNKEKIPAGNLNFPVIHKHKAYQYESEIRLIYFTKDFLLEKDWKKEEIEEGLFLTTDLNELIDEIIIGPYSPKWFTKLVSDLTNKYGLDKCIKKSEMCLIE
jgi:hypothetical protein